jgi:hypothetical protein
MGDVMKALNRLCKWRTVLAGWHLGTKMKFEPGVPAMRDLQDNRLIVRVELTALTYLLFEKGIITKAEWEAAVEREADELDKMYRRKFPGYTATDTGITIDPELAQETNRRLSFPD